VAAVRVKTTKTPKKGRRQPREKAVRGVEKFLQHLAEGNSVSGAARGTGTSRATLYALRKEDDEIRARWDEAVEQGTDVLEDLALKRARTSDTLIIFLLKARRPERYKDRIEVTDRKLVECLPRFTQSTE
jgi:hypothetical protein